MKALWIVKVVFAVIGTGLSIGALFLYRSSSEYLERALRAEGEVVDLHLSRGSSSDDGPTYRPVVRFSMDDGAPREFTSSTGSNPASYSVGERVEVLYFEDSPQDAKINSFSDLWLGTLILGGLGATFFLIGGGMILATMRATRLATYLRAHGTPISAEFQSVSVNTSVRVNGRSPFRIVSQWRNPSTSKVHVFTSDNIWFDPTQYAASRPIRVFIDPRNPKKYLVDLSFLPELAD